MLLLILTSSDLQEIMPSFFPFLLNLHYHLMNPKHKAIIVLLLMFKPQEDP